MNNTRYDVKTRHACLDYGYVIKFIRNFPRLDAFARVAGWSSENDQKSIRGKKLGYRCKSEDFNAFASLIEESKYQQITKIYFEYSGFINGKLIRWLQFPKSN